MIGLGVPDGLVAWVDYWGGQCADKRERASDLCAHDRAGLTLVPGGSQPSRAGSGVRA